MRAARCGAFVLMAASGARAQTVRLRMTDSATQPLVGALVALLDSSGMSRSVSLSDRAGAALLQTATPGRYSVEVRRVGWTSFASDPVHLGPNEIVPLALHVGG